MPNPISSPNRAPLPELSIVVPAYNEAQRLPRGLSTLLDYARRRTERIEIIVVDDGSGDQTVAAAEQALSAAPDLSPVDFQVLANGQNRGKGYSVRRGMLAARGQRVLFTDADLSTPIDELECLEAALDQGADIAIGSRDIAGAHVLEHQPWYRELAGKTFNVAVRTLAIRGIRDTQCGFKLFRREVIPPIFESQTIERWGFDVEILFIAHRLGHRIAEVPVRWVNDAQTKVNMLRDGSEMVADLLRIRWRHRRL